MDPTAATRFLGVLALELRDGAPPAHAALGAAAAGELAVQLGEALAGLAASARDADLALLGAHFDPAEARRPGWPLHQRALDLLRHAPQQTTPGQAHARRVVGFGADANGGVPMPLQCDLDLVGGGLRVPHRLSAPDLVPPSLPSGQDRGHEQEGRPVRRDCG